MPTKVFFQEYYAYYKNWSAYGEGGMSGGPVFAYTNNQFYECAVFVSDGFGVRALDNEANDFINSHLP